MPNWCYTTYKIFGSKESRDEIKKVLDKMKADEEPVVENGFGTMWLGCLLHYLGEDWHNVYCRGSVIDYDVQECRGEQCLRIDTETAWTECKEVRDFLQEKFEDLTIYYISEESGMEEYYTNDVTGDIFLTRYFLDTCCTDLDSEYFRTIEEAADYINASGVFDTKVEPTLESINNAIEEYLSKHEDEDEYISFHEYQIED